MFAMGKKSGSEISETAIQHSVTSFADPFAKVCYPRYFLTSHNSQTRVVAAKSKSWSELISPVFKVTPPFMPDFDPKKSRTKIRLNILELILCQKHFDTHSVLGVKPFRNHMFLCKTFLVFLGTVAHLRTKR